MRLHQLSLFVENRPGQLNTPCRLLAEAGIDIRTLTLADSQNYGILRLIVSEWEKAKGVLEAAGCVIKVTEVVGLEVPDRPGGLSEVLDVLDRARVNIEYMYAFTWGRVDKAVMIFRFDQPEAAIQALGEAGFSLVASDAVGAKIEA
jgi:hypothetical protein